MIAIALLAACGAAPARAVHSSPSSAATDGVSSAATALPALERSVDLDGAVLGGSDAAATLVISCASWCEHCHDELRVLAGVRAAHPTVRILGLNYRGHEAYDHRGNADAVRAYVAAHAPWLRVIPADDALFAAFGAPPRIPTMFVYDRAGHLAATYDVRTRKPPDAAELETLLAHLGV